MLPHRYLLGYFCRMIFTGGCHTDHHVPRGGVVIVVLALRMLFRRRFSCCGRGVCPVGITRIHSRGGVEGADLWTRAVADTDTTLSTIRRSDGADAPPRIDIYSDEIFKE